MYHSGAITDKKDTLAALREWAVGAMGRFQPAMEKHGNQHNGGVKTISAFLAIGENKSVRAVMGDGLHCLKPYASALRYFTSPSHAKEREQFHEKSHCHDVGDP